MTSRSCAYEGLVEHRRLRPSAHRFRYRIFMLYLDLGELPGALDNRLLWSARRPAPARFRRADYPGDTEQPLDAWVRDLVAARTGVRPSGPVHLLTHLRYVGVWFNPISVYYCFADDGRTLEWAVLEVTSTPWRERTHYVLDVRGEADPRPSTGRNESDPSHPTPRRASRGAVRGEADPRHPTGRNDSDPSHPTPRRASRGAVAARPDDADVGADDLTVPVRGSMAKAMHVSPFLPMVLRYDWMLTAPGERLALTVDVADAAGVVLATSLVMRRRPLTRRSMARLLLRHPPMSLAVLGGIHWQAFLLWRKGTPYHRRRPGSEEKRAAA